MKDSWKDRTVIVTGGSAGLGKSLARAFARQGAQVLMVARGQASLASAQQDLAVEGLQVEMSVADVTVPDQFEGVLHSVRERFGRLDVLVNNAGRSSRGLALETSLEDYRSLWELNFLATVSCTQLAAKDLIQTGGHVVNIGSLAAKTASPMLGAYPSSKFPVAAFTQQLRLELEPQGVHVMLVCPGPIRREDAGSRYDRQAEGLPPEARKPGGGVKLKGLDPDELARRIVDGCVRRRAELILPRKARWLFAVSQLWPRMGDRIVRKMTSGRGSGS